MNEWTQHKKPCYNQQIASVYGIGVQELACTFWLLATLHSVTSAWKFETGHGGNIYTADIGIC